MSWKGMSRMHDKYMIVDDSVYLLGGRNLFDCFLGNQDSFKNHDRDVLVYNTGGAESSLYQVKSYFEDIWELDCCRVWKDSSLNGMIPSYIAICKRAVCFLWVKRADEKCGQAGNYTYSVYYM